MSRALSSVGSLARRRMSEGGESSLSCDSYRAGSASCHYRYLSLTPSPFPPGRTTATLIATLKDYFNDFKVGGGVR